MFLSLQAGGLTGRVRYAAAWVLGRTRRPGARFAVSSRAFGGGACAGDPQALYACAARVLSSAMRHPGGARDKLPVVQLRALWAVGADLPALRPRPGVLRGPVQCLEPPRLAAPGIGPVPADSGWCDASRRPAAGLAGTPDAQSDASGIVNGGVRRQRIGRGLAAGADRCAPAPATDAEPT